MPQINKIMNITCKFLNLVSNIIFTVTVICTSLVAEEVPSTKNGITISAIADGTNAENSQILCTVINQSAYPLVSANRGTECHAFQFKLYDANGKILAQNEEWANKNAQIGSYRYNHPRFFLNDQILPNDKIEFQLNLKDAYDNRAVFGRNLIVSWENIYPGPNVEIGGRPYQNGQVINLHTEEFRFPEVFNLAASVILPGTKPQIPDSNPNSQQQSSGTSSSADQSHGESSLTIATLNDSQTTWWWLLLAIPILALSFYIILKK